MHPPNREKRERCAAIISTVSLVETSIKRTLQKTQLKTGQIRHNQSNAIGIFAIFFSFVHAVAKSARYSLNNTKNAASLRRRPNIVCRRNRLDRTPNNQRRFSSAHDSRGRINRAGLIFVVAVRLPMCECGAFCGLLVMISGGKTRAQFSVARLSTEW